MKFEYKIFNMSESSLHNTKVTKKEDKRSWLDFLNKYGFQGWQVVDRISKTSYLLMREIDVDSAKILGG